MATTVSIRATPATPKIKKPPPPALQTALNSAPQTNSSTSSTTTSKRTPSLPNNSPSLNCTTLTNSSSNAKSTIRQRRESHKTSQGRTNNKGAIIDGGELSQKTPKKKFSEPHVRTTSYILQKFNGKSPSLVIHLHPTHFRFDQQDGSFGYTSPMRVILEHIKAQTVPHDMLEELFQAKVPFYDGCLIVEVHDHKTVAATVRPQTTDSSGYNNLPFSIHNYNQHLTPSPYRPFPKQPPSTQPKSTNSKNDAPANQQENSSPAADSKMKSSAKKQARIFTTVLHPTSLSRHREIAILATTVVEETRSSNKRQSSVLATSSSGYASTPLASVPASLTNSKGPPAKRQRMLLEEKDIHEFEGTVLVATEPPLLLDPALNFSHAQTIIKSLTHPLHNHPPPPPRTGKRTYEELAADEAAQAEEERVALIMDERLHPSLNANNAGQGSSTAEGHNAARDFQPDFSRFKTLEDIKRRHEEDKIRKQEEERKAQVQKREQQLATQELEKEKRRRAEADRERAARQEQMRTLAQQRQQAQQPLAPGQNPTARGPAIQQHLMQNLQRQQSPQGQQGSPVIRYPTPSSSSPVVGVMSTSQPPTSMSMAHTASNGLGSPPRPGSAVPMQAGLSQVPMNRQVSQQHSQASQSRTGTPSMQYMTPSMNHVNPSSGHMTPQPNAQQGSPLQQNMQRTPIIGMGGVGASQVNGAQVMNVQQQQIFANQLRAQQMHPQGQMQGHANMSNQVHLMQVKQQAAVRARAQQMAQLNTANTVGAVNAAGISANTTGAVNTVGAANTAGAANNIQVTSPSTHDQYRRQMHMTQANLLRQATNAPNHQGQTLQPGSRPASQNFNPNVSGANFPNTAASMAPQMSRGQSHAPLNNAQAQSLGQHQMHNMQNTGNNINMAQHNQMPPHMHQNAILPNEQPQMNVNGLTREQQQQQMMSLRNPQAHREKIVFFQDLIARNGGALPLNAEQLYNDHLARRRMAAQHNELASMLQHMSQMSPQQRNELMARMTQQQRDQIMQFSRQRQQQQQQQQRQQQQQQQQQQQREGQQSTATYQQLLQNNLAQASRVQSMQQQQQQQTGMFGQQGGMPGNQNVNNGMG